MNYYYSKIKEGVMHAFYFSNIIFAVFILMCIHVYFSTTYVFLEVLKRKYACDSFFSIKITHFILSGFILY